MKKLTILIAIIVVFTTNVQAQKYALGGYTEFTHISPKQGFLFTIQNWDGAKIGAFYQREITNSNIVLEGLAKKAHEVSFAGLYASIPCYKKKNISIDFEVRTGFRNGQYFAITPSFKGNYTVGKRIVLNAGVGTRNFRPTVMAGTSFILGR